MATSKKTNPSDDLFDSWPSQLFLNLLDPFFHCNDEHEIPSAPAVDWNAHVDGMVGDLKTQDMAEADRSTPSKEEQTFARAWEDLFIDHAGDAESPKDVTTSTWSLLTDSFDCCTPAEGTRLREVQRETVITSKNKEDSDISQYLSDGFGNLANFLPQSSSSPTQQYGSLRVETELRASKLRGVRTRLQSMMLEEPSPRARGKNLEAMKKAMKNSWAGE
ncbi:hypothetical protein GUITHDRAFT_115422 [Guillardia theta CCMP2712]|uniref:Uncharacterized protein n=1 Tax=Guillardia theta (strain CCMP2712) TaxID=905079 RepID=L1IQ95_GUITC|nr:hypothetical protein GUITHDRAFT_115422 [Guillardia theta CCMP2712]EKX38456.1 hypothetical protein GUITHDRAFT_115422 [Guillardia theta CCMP2712]|eukprot:XP_005825436.1 hypothetical protein GUITHDRAFT_115422 [Guillardia theta CCMP2712]